MIVDMRRSHILLDFHYIVDVAIRAPCWLLLKSDVPISGCGGGDKSSVMIVDMRRSHILLDFHVLVMFQFPAVAAVKKAAS